ncbi:MAG: sigma-54-dependent Fis family transcriptional regulator [Desulfobulbus propionicus]|nr:MAG: sigma-54-dependent Fis family transcriptional regulator [Desulfobulbus propionicus]
MHTDSPHPTYSILVVDDEESLRNTFQFFLKNEGYAPVLTASTFAEAMDAISIHSFDLIVSDIVLGGHSGIDFLRSIRQQDITCPVVMITGYPNVDSAAESVRLGAFDYIPKPVEKETLLKTARLALQQWQLQNERRRMEQEQDQYRFFLETIFKSVTDGIVTVDTSFRVIHMNPAARLLFSQLYQGEVDNRILLNLFSEDNFLPLKNNLLQVLKTGLETVEHRLECWEGAKKKKILSICTSPLKGTANCPDGLVLTFRDMTNPANAAISPRTKFHGFIGGSDAMQAAYTMVENVGRVDLTVLITGESGTGKELAAEALHKESRRKNRRLVKVDCTAIPENLLETELFGHRKGSFTGADRDRMGRILQADGGTLFLDEIGDISAMMQLRLLRFLQESTFYPVGRDTPITVDVRVIAATNVDLKKKVQKGEFREDLYFRLRVIDIMLPPLRERDNDIELLAAHFVEQTANTIGKSINGLSAQAVQVLRRYYWPGNVRELQHTMERACVLCSGPTISTDELPAEIIAYAPARRNANPKAQHQHISATPPLPAASPTSATPSAVDPTQEKPTLPMDVRIMQALQKTGGNKAKAARYLNIDRTTLYRKIKEFNLDLSSLDL